MLSISYLQHFVESNAEIAYMLIVLGVILEGEIVVIIAGIFAHLGALNIFFAFIATMVGGGLKSVIGYSIGYYLQKHHSHHLIVRQSERKIHHFFPRFSERQFWSIFLSRFLILGLHWFSLIFSGYRRIKMKIFTEGELASLLVWSSSILALGYFFSHTALSISKDVRKFLGIILVFLVLFFIVEKIIAFIIELVETKDKNI